MTAGLSRRDLFQRVAAAGVGVALVGSTEMLLTAPASADTGVPEIGYGPLVADPAKRLALPRGFRYSIVARRGHEAGDG